MIPYKLELKNFLSYGATTEVINFGHHQLICLSGKNGHGKSALLDAMTWALWGQARKVPGATKADEGLLRLGQSDMMVTLEFECNQQRYRICREFTKSYGRNQVTLDFEVFNNESESYASLTDTTVRATQVKIISLLGLDFETFVNTAFLRQGQSNEFSCKNPKERKEILGSILGLSRYDELRSSALERAKKCGNEKSILVAVDEQVLKELEREEELRKQEVQLKKEITDSEKRIAACTTSLDRAEKERLEVLNKKQKHTLFKEDIKNKESEKENLEKEFIATVVEWRRIHVQSMQGADAITLEEEKRKLLTQERIFRLAQQKTLELQERLLKIQEALRIAEEKCRRDHEKQARVIKEELDAAISELKQDTFVADQNKKQIVELEKEITIISKEQIVLAKKIKDLAPLVATISSHEKQFEKRRSFYQVLVSKGNWIASQLRECEHKKLLLNDRDNPACPTCDQVLTARRKQFLAHKFDKNELLSRHQLNRIRNILGRLKEILQFQYEQAKKYVQQSDELKKCTHADEISKKRSDEIDREFKTRMKQVKLFEQQIKVLENKIKKIQVVHDEHNKNIEKALAQEPGVAGQRVLIEQCEKEKKTFSYDRVKHYEVFKKIDVCEKKLHEFEQIEKEQGQQEMRRARVHDYVVQLKKLGKAIYTLKEKNKKHVVTDHQSKDVEMKVQEIKVERGQLLKSKEEYVRRFGSVTSDLQRIEKYKEESYKRKKYVAALTTEMYEYQTLATIFGKDGLQALLIEEAIPEIEDEANRLLSRLTDNNAQVMIESLRDLKKGGAKETLEIKISDASGIRPYELFSGGEAFRIDFALRIAISRLLARRAGTALQTLIIDEGFGSQDEDGLARLMDALHVLREDFARVIVVSHLPIFKDNFPVHFVVEKSATGSHVTTVERG